MIGNDIIDLDLARQESNWQRPGWLQKLFSAEEQEIIRSSEATEQTIWLLWSMKEAAYKIAHRQSGITIFAPLKLRCELLEQQQHYARGHVVTGGMRCATFSTMSNGYLHTIATLQNNLAGINVYIHSEKYGRQPDYAGYRFLKDEKGIPYLEDVSGTTRVVSKSHHGRFEAVIF